MQKSKTQVKHDNLVAQIDVLKKDLRDVNTDLTNKVKERDSLNNELLSGKTTLDKLKIEYTTIIQKIKIGFQELFNREQTLNKKEDNIYERELTLIEQIKVDKKNDKERNRLEHKLLHLSSQVENDEIIVKINKNTISELEKTIKHLGTQTAHIKQTEYEKNEEIGKLDLLIKEKLTNFDRQIKDKVNELTKLETLVLKEQDKIIKPLERLEQETQILNRKKRNLDIMIMRFNKTFNTYYPNIELKV